MDIIKYFGGIAFITAAVVYLAKLLIKQSFSKDLEVFKSNLEKEAHKERTRFEKLHAERAEVIKEIYSRIVRTQRAFESLMKPIIWTGETSEEEKSKELTSEFNGLSDFYGQNRIFLEESLATEIDNLLTKWLDIWYQWMEVKDIQRSGQAAKKWNEAWDKVKSEIPPVKKSIEDRLRAILGIDTKR